MGVYVHPRTFRLFQKFIQVSQVVTADQYTGIFPHADVHFRDFRVPVSIRVGFVEQGHGVNAIFTAFQYHLHELIGGQWECGGYQPPVDEFVDGRVLVSEIIGVFRVGGHSFHPVGKHFF